MFSPNLTGAVECRGGQSFACIRMSIVWRWPLAFTSRITRTVNSKARGIISSLHDASLGQLLVKFGDFVLRLSELCLQPNHFFAFATSIIKSGTGRSCSRSCAGEGIGGGSYGQGVARRRMIKTSCVLNRFFIRLEGVDYSLLLVELGEEFVHRVRISCSRDIVTEFHLLSLSVNCMLRVNIGNVTFGRP